MKLIYIESTIFVMLAYFLFLGEPLTFEKTGDNYFHVQLNGREIGTVSEPEEAQKLLIQARRAVAGKEAEMVFMEAELSCTGEEVLWGEVDDKDVLKGRMETVLADAVQETMHRSYTVKIDEYTVNLSSLDEVDALLQAAIDQ